jgi:hypothetical protein
MMDVRAHKPWFAKIALLAGLALAPAVAAGQTPLPRPPSTAPTLNEPSQLDQSPSAIAPAPQDSNSGGSGTLGNALSRSQGVIQPAQPAIDPGMAQSPPPTGPNSTPVITPRQNTPSGDTVTPK